MDAKGLAGSLYPDTQDYVLRMENGDVFVGTLRVVLDEVYNSLRVVLTGTCTLSHPLDAALLPLPGEGVFTLSTAHIVALWPVPAPATLRRHSG